MPAAQTFLQSATDLNTRVVYTYASQNLGSAASDRYILVLAAAPASGVTALTATCTIAGVAAVSSVSVLNQVSNTSRFDMFLASVPTGTSGNVVITYSRSVQRSLINLYRLTGIDGLTPFSTATATTDPATGTLTIPAGGIAVAGGFASMFSALSTVWTNLTERFDVQNNTQGLVMTSASDDFATLATSRSIECNFASSPSLPVAAFAAWSPSAAAATTYRKNHLLIGCS